MNRPEGISESDLIDAMCLTWRHDFGLPAPSTDANGRMAWSDGFAVGMTQQERDGLRLQMRQLYEHHIKPAIQSSVEAERERAAKVAEQRYTFESVNKNKKGFPYQSGHVAIHCAEQIAAAIRKGA